MLFTYNFIYSFISYRLKYNKQLHMSNKILYFLERAPSPSVFFIHLNCKVLFGGGGGSEGMGRGIFKSCFQRRNFPKK